MYSFPEKRPDENVIRVLRRHKIFFSKPIIYSLIILGLLGAAFYFLIFETWLAAVILIVAFFIIGILFFFYWYLWVNDLYILTDQRLIDVDQNAIFTRVVSEMSLDKIQDVTYKVEGPLATWLSFGDIIIKTAGPAEDVVIEMISHPQGVTQEISTNFKAYREKKGLIKEEVVVNKNNPTPSAPAQTTQGEQL